MALHKTDAELLDLIHSVTTKSTSKPDRSFGCKHRTGKETSNEESHEEADTEFADRQNVSGSDFSTEKMESELSAGQADTQTKGGNLNIDSELDDGESDEDKSYLFLLSKDELVHSLQDCRTELDLTNKKVEKLERQLKKSDDYNSVLRKMVEKLSSEIHRMKHVRTVHMHVQVDKEDLLNYTTGGVVAPSWREDDHSAITMALEGTSTEKKDNSQLTIEGMSIAESVKAAAEAAVQQQQQTEQEAMLAQSGYQYDVTSGLYYHAESGYYYDPATSLFYDPKSLTYYYYDYNQGKYMFHSKVETQHPDVSARKTSKRQTQSVKASIPKDSCSTLDGLNRKQRREELKKREDMLTSRKGKGEWHHMKDEIGQKMQQTALCRAVRRKSGGRKKRRHSEDSSSESSVSGDSRSRSRSISGRMSRSSSRSRSKECKTSKGKSKHKKKHKHRKRKTKKSKENESLNDGIDEKTVETINSSDFESDNDLVINKGEQDLQELKLDEVSPDENHKSELLIQEKGAAELANEDDKESIVQQNGESLEDPHLSSEHGTSMDKKHSSKSKHQKRRHKHKKKRLKKKNVSEEEIESGECSDSDSELALLDTVSSGELSDDNVEDVCEEWAEGGWDTEGVAVYSQLEGPGTDFYIAEPGQTFGTHENPELAQNWPPCIRMIVTASDHLSVGSLFIVPCTGASIGREKAAITIPDLNVSKLHATISYNQDSCVYEIVDNASQNGTLVNDQRISEAKVQSCPVVVSHGSMVQVAGTRLLCHIHAGTVTCDACEPGVVRAGNQKNTADHKVLTKEQRKLKQRREINQIKKKYGLKNSKYEDNAQVFTNPQYEDKASVRRQTVGSDVPGHKHEAPASVTRPITSSNVGHKLLSKMGWKEGESLGKDNSGIQEPISITMRVHQTAGLGSAGAGGFSVDDAGSVDMKKAARRVQAQERYKRIQTGEDTKQSDHRTETSLWSQGVTEFNTG
ncbi:angiogenic factor with G patch and FHA domains 1-like isoform X1 [Mya arenaria]|uniref:angiogenic factor with G patch and FHA domains 1-like isoform X1 n=1 Tax=Mya arenaria TaxID=6604 RepID=UPI0022E3433B|nr:angiogenic factor with G patch and FHA domains 1-like isoform X1 [Mya arenaria]XP_052795781.1 angiogenic factor with G patch and FHA domains 1-like isoform X1 [Mya arenaria]